MEVMMKKINRHIILLIAMLSFATVNGQYFSAKSNTFGVDTYAPHVLSSCIEQGSYFLPGQEIYLDFYISEANLTTVELGISLEEKADIQILGPLPYPGPAFITIPEVSPTPFARLYIIAKDSFGHETYHALPEEGYFNIGPHLQTIDVPAGWSGISNPYIPADPNIDNILADVIDDVVILQNLEGVYWPGGNVYTLNTWEVFKGYLIKAENAFTIDLEGTSLECFWYGFTFPAGWGLFSIPGNCDIDAQQFFDWNLYTSEIIKEAAGWKVLWPNYNINTIEVLERGKSYFIKSEWANEDFSFNPCWEGEKTKEFNEFKVPDNWNHPVNTPASHVIAFPQKVLEKAGITENMILGAFNSAGTCVGASPAKACHITVFGNDNTTKSTDGMIAGDYIYFRAWDPDTDEEVLLTAEFDGNLPNQGVFIPDGMSAITALKAVSLGLGDISENIFSIYPNPSSGLLTIETEKTVSYLVSITDVKGTVVATQKINGKTTLDLSYLQKGIYFVKATNGNNVIVKKLVLE
jgi:hypothetical protein